jgi:hypothetical protein
MPGKTEAVYLLLHNIYKFSLYLTGSTIIFCSVARNSPLDHRGGYVCQNFIKFFFSGMDEGIHKKARRQQNNIKNLLSLFMNKENVTKIGQNFEFKEYNPIFATL